MMSIEPEKQERLRRLPAVEAVLQKVRGLRLAPAILTELVRLELEAARWSILKQERDELPPGIEAETIGARVTRRVQALSRPRPLHVVNATGVLVHTNLGRSPLASSAVAHMAAVASRYSDLEFNLESGGRGSRQDHVEELLRLLTGAQDVLVVNNNAAAVLLALAGLARGKEVIVSRGELVEIGGSFRIPDVLEQSGAVLREVGTTNRTHSADYEKAVGEETALLLKVHPSNYRVEGFTGSVSISDLAGLARKARLPLLVDLGSGALTDFASLVDEPEPLVRSTLVDGADLVTFSGDKLLGGPQAGVIAGNQQLVKRLKTHPLARAVRADKLLLAGLQSTLTAYLDTDRAKEEIPLLRMFWTSVEVLRSRATKLAAGIAQVLAKTEEGQPGVTVTEGEAASGGGSMPGGSIPSVWVVLDPGGRVSAQELQRALRSVDPPVIARVSKEKLILDVRTVFEDELEQLPALVASAWASARRETEARTGLVKERE